MEEVELVIKLSEKDLKIVRDTILTISEMFDTTRGRVYCAIANGILLPKGHGDLIDKSDLLTTTDIRADGSEFTYVSYSEINNATIVVEADKEDSDVDRTAGKCAEEYRRIAELLKDYKRLKEQESCEDCISRKAVLDLVVANHTELNEVNVVMYSPLCKDIKQLPPIPLKPKSDVLDKIRAEVIQSIQNGTLKIESGTEMLFRILDKYKIESEDEEHE